MALTIDTEIAEQQATSTATYCYLYEPLRISILEDDLLSTRLWIDLELVETEDSNNIVETFVRYGDFDIIGGRRIAVDLMQLARQLHDSNVYNFSSIDDIVNFGWTSVVSKYKYRFKIYTDISQTPLDVFKLPIIGGRQFKDFVGLVDENSPITEAVKNSFDLNNRWNGYSTINTNLSPANQVDSRPTITSTLQTQGRNACGGYIVWKSTLGGWMTWGFNIKNESQNHSYEGKIENNYFQSTQEVGGNPYIPVDYTGIQTSRTLSLKDIGISYEELIVASSILETTAVYFSSEDESRLELMRMTSASAPLSSLRSGGDFTVSLRSIISNAQKTR